MIGSITFYFTKKYVLKELAKCVSKTSESNVLRKTFSYNDFVLESSLKGFKSECIQNVPLSESEHVFFYCNNSFTLEKDDAVMAGLTTNLYLLESTFLDPKNTNLSNLMLWRCSSFQQASDRLVRYVKQHTPGKSKEDCNSDNDVFVDAFDVPEAISAIEKAEATIMSEEAKNEKKREMEDRPTEAHSKKRTSENPETSTPTIPATLATKLNRIEYSLRQKELGSYMPHFELSSREHKLDLQLAERAAEFLRVASFEDNDNQLEFFRENGSIQIYTDGSCLGNGTENAISGLGVAFGPSHFLNLSLRVPILDSDEHTNNAAELYALYATLRIMEHLAILCVGLQDFGIYKTIQQLRVCKRKDANLNAWYDETLVKLQGQVSYDRIDMFVMPLFFGNVDICSDSQYSISAVDLWYRKWTLRADGYYKSLSHKMKNSAIINLVICLKQRRLLLIRYLGVTNVDNLNFFKKVRAHSGHIGNELADTLAKNAI